MSGTILGPKEYARQLDRVIRVYPKLFEGVTDPLERERKARNLLMWMKIYQRADHGPLADVRELIAFRLAPWLRPHA